MDTILIIIERDRDDAGIYTYFARRPTDYDFYGIPKPNTPCGRGETKYMAVGDLAAQLDDRESK